MDFLKGISEVFRGKNGFLSYENKDRSMTVEYWSKKLESWQ